MIIDTKEAILFVANEAKNNKEKFGKTKLNKILYFADLGYFMRNGERITDAIYTKHNFGPVVAGLDKLLGQMQEEGILHLRLVDNAKFGSRTEISILDKPAEKAGLEKQYRKLKIEAGNVIDNYDADSISELSHDKVWNFFDFGDVIDFEIARAIKMESTNEATREWANKHEITISV